MKALVLAAGLGTRLRPITHTFAKQLVPVANRPVLFYGLEAIASAGVREVGLVVGAGAREIRAAVGDGSAFGLRTAYLPQQAPLGLAHAVLIAREWLGDDDFVMYLGDNFIQDGIDQMVDDFRAGEADAQVLLAPVPDPTAFGVAEVGADGRVTALAEKPERPRSDLALVGAYVFTRAVHDAVRAVRPSARGELEITDALSWLVGTGRAVRATRLTGYWKDTGSAAGMLEVNRTVLDTSRARVEGEVDDSSELVGQVVVERGARVLNSRIVGPAVIGARSVISDSHIGPYASIAEGCHVRHSEIEDSIVLPGARLEGVRRVESSLIGREVMVTSARRRPVVHQLILGDHSQVHV